jgi:hypothetical protein
VVKAVNGALCTNHCVSHPGVTCLTSSGLPGFTQDAWRVIRKDGREIALERFSWRYDPEPRFVCGTKP